MKPTTSNFACQGPSSNLIRRKSGCGSGLGELPEIWGFPFNTSAMAEASDFKFGTAWVWQGPSLNPTPKKKMDVVLYYRSSQKFWGSPLIIVQRPKLATSNLASRWSSPRPTIITTTRGKSRRGLGLGNLPNIWGSPLIFLNGRTVLLALAELLVEVWNGRHWHGGCGQLLSWHIVSLKDKAHTTDLAYYRQLLLSQKYVTVIRVRHELYQVKREWISIKFL